MKITNLSTRKESQIKTDINDIEVSKYNPLSFQFPQFDYYPFFTGTLCEGNTLYYEFKQKVENLVPDNQTYCLGLDCKNLPMLYFQFYALSNNDVLILIYGYPVEYMNPLKIICFNTKKRPIEEKENEVWESCNRLYTKYISSPKHMLAEVIKLVKNQMDFIPDKYLKA